MVSIDLWNQTEMREERWKTDENLPKLLFLNSKYNNIQAKHFLWIEYRYNIPQRNRGFWLDESILHAFFTKRAVSLWSMVCRCDHAMHVISTWSHVITACMPSKPYTFTTCVILLIFCRYFYRLLLIHGCWNECKTRWLMFSNINKLTYDGPSYIS